MKSEPLNTLPIQQFIQQVKTADNSRAKEVKIPLDQAKNLAYTLGIVMSRLNGELEKILLNDSKSDEVIEVRVDGGSGFNN